MKTDYWDQIEEAFEDVDIYESYEVFEQGASRYPEWKIDIFSRPLDDERDCQWRAAPVFENSTGIFAPEAVLGFQRIGKPELAAALLKAMSLLGEPYPRERKERTERLAALTCAPIATGQAFSVVPKWVAKKAGMPDAQDPFVEMDELIGAASDSMDEALDEYAGANGLVFHRGGMTAARLFAIRAARWPPLIGDLGRWVLT